MITTHTNSLKEQSQHDMFMIILIDVLILYKINTIINFLFNFFIIFYIDNFRCMNFKLNGI